MATINISEFATIIEATPRDARKFLREVTPDDAQPGKGGRWAIEKRDLRSLRSKFAKWDDARNAPDVKEISEEDAEMIHEAELAEIDEALPLNA